MNYTGGQIWLIIALMAVGTFAIRFSFLGLIGDREMPDWLLKLLRYTPVAVIPAMVAPLVLWPEVAGGDIEPVRLTAAFATVMAGLLIRNVLGSILIGALTLFAGLYLTGLL